MENGCRLRNESGQTAVDYAGIIFIVVALVITLATAGATTTIGETITCKVSSAVSQIGGGTPSSCDGAGQNPHATPPEKDDKKPSICASRTTTTSSGSYIEIGFIKIGSSFSLAVQEESYTDESGNIKARYSVVATDGGELAAVGSVGTKGEVNGSGLGADLSFEAGFNVKAGDTWDFESEEELNSFLDSYNDYRIQQMQIMNDETGMMALYLAGNGGLVDPPRKADHTTVSGGAQLKGKAEGGARLGKDSEPGGSINLNIGLYANASTGSTYSQQTDHRKGHEGEVTQTETYSGSIGGGANAVFAGLSGTGTYEGAMSTKYDKNGRLIEVSFTQSTSGDLTWNATNGPVKGSKEGNGTVKGTTSDKTQTVTTTTLPVTDKNREVVEYWLNNEAYVVTPDGQYILRLPPNVLNPDSPVPDDAMQQALYEGATSTTSYYDTDEDGFSIGGSVSLGLKVGAGVSMSDKDSKLVDQTYLDSPGTPGASRPRKQTELCNE